MAGVYKGAQEMHVLARCAQMPTLVHGLNACRAAAFWLANGA